MNADKEVGKLEIFLSFGSLIVVSVIGILLKYYFHVPMRGLPFI